METNRELLSRFQKELLFKTRLMKIEEMITIKIKKIRYNISLTQGKNKMMLLKTGL